MMGGENLRREFSARAIILGIVLASLFGMGNAYLILYSGLSFSVSLPTTLLSVLILSGLFRNGTPLESNTVQTIATLGIASTTGITLTVSALLVSGIWTQVQLGPTLLICLIGGLLGVFLTAFLRPLFSKHFTLLPFPEGIACAEVLKKGASGLKEGKTLLISFAIGAVSRFLVSGLGIFSSILEGTLRLGSIGFYAGSSFSFSLLGIGYLSGLDVALSLFLGSAIAWWVAIPLSGLGMESINLTDSFWMVWTQEVRYLGVGTLMVAGWVALYDLRVPLWEGVKKLRPERDGKERWNRTTLVFAFVTLTSLLGLAYLLIGQLHLSFFSTLSSLGLAVILGALAIMMVGIIGTAQSPFSLLGILAAVGATLFFPELFSSYSIVSLTRHLVTGIVICAICCAAFLSQTLRTGSLVGANPKRQQWMGVIGVVVPSLVVVPFLAMLHRTYGIGTGQPHALAAPQANLMASLLAGAAIPWSKVAWGAILGVTFFIVDKVLEVRNAPIRVPMVAVALGLYLPFNLAVPILAGGLLTRWLEKERGLNFAVGLVAGEAVMALILGALLYWKKDWFPMMAAPSVLMTVVGALLMAGLIYQFIFRPTQKVSGTN